MTSTSEIEFDEATAAPAAALPVHLTRFVGRQRELERLLPLLSSTRIVTITGAGGSGKTRLAREVAARAERSFQQVGWIDFAPLSEGALAAQQVIDALHIPERLGTAPLDVLLADIADRMVLLVFDNCEHLVGPCAELAEALLRRCRQLTILATSREALGVASETSWLLPPLDSDEALQLFVERAQSALSSFMVTNVNRAAVQEICRRLDGIPLAIELAAARVRALSPEQIAERLQDAFRLLKTSGRGTLPRHRTLRGVIDWSYSLLTRREQLLLARLSVFAGGFSLAAAEDVCSGEPLEEEDILDGVTALVEKSLVSMQPGDRLARYRLLETVRQYGMERLAEQGDVDTRRARHAGFFAALAEQTHPLLIGGEHEPGVVARVKADADNLRAACAWSLSDDAHADMVLRLAGALFWYWYCTGQFHEAREFLGAALGVARDHGRAPLLRARALLSCGLLELAQGSYDKSRALFEEARPIALACGDPMTAGVALAKLGASHLMLGDAETADRVLEESDRFARDLPPIVYIFGLFWHGWSRLARGDVDGARERFETGLRRGLELKYPTTTAHSMAMVGHVDIAQGRLDEAFARVSDALARHIDLGDVWGMGLDFDAMAALAAARGEHERAVAVLAGVDALRERTGIALPAVARAQRDRLVAVVRQGLGVSYERLYATWRVRPLDDVVRTALADGPRASAQTAAGPAAGASLDTMAAPPAPRPATAAAERVEPPESARNQAEPLEAADQAPGVPKLRVLALGPLQAYVGERAIDSAAWGSARPRELLVYLLMHPEGRTKEQVAAAFWPEATPPQQRNSFHVTLHRLRKAVGNPDVVTVAGDRYRVDEALVEEFDVAAFEREVTAARRALKRSENGAVAALERVVARYRGDFLDGEPAGDWHLQHRDQLQHVYTQALLALGATLAGEERYAKAADAYRRVLARDEVHEEALRALMVCHARLGERSSALRLYQRFAERLRKELEVDPARETTKLFERLQLGAPV